MSAHPNPLVVDLDGTLVHSDLLVESILLLLKKNLLFIFLLPIWLLSGKAHFKYKIASRVQIDASVLPYNAELIAYLSDQHASGRSLILATASSELLAAPVAKHLAIFSKVVASTQQSNFKGQSKADELNKEYGSGHYDYAGNSKADLAVWQHAGEAILVGVPAHLRNKVANSVSIAKEFEGSPPTLRSYLQALRMHQWVKNILLFVPVLTAHKVLDIYVLATALLAFAAFCCCASSAYVLNDLLDLEADRHHRNKRDRPFACGALPLTHGLAMIALLLLGAVCFCWFLPFEFCLVLAVYYLTTSTYTCWLKQLIVIDVIVLASLYTFRIIAGSAATLIPLSEWLLAFSMFIFLSLAMVKRYVELLDLRNMGFKEEAVGRGYHVRDIELLSSLGGASGYLSVLVFALYLNSDLVQSMYTRPYLLWLVCPLLLYWISRAWIIAHRGDMHDDPIVFAIKDPVSIITGALVVAIFLVAAL